VHALPVLLIEVAHSVPAPIQNAQPERFFSPRLKRFKANLQGIAGSGDREPHLTDGAACEAVTRGAERQPVQRAFIIHSFWTLLQAVTA
jgi:hypothetical protein